MSVMKAAEMLINKGKAGFPLFYGNPANSGESGIRTRSTKRQKPYKSRISGVLF
jgi:hypothetical protein